MTLSKLQQRVKQYSFPTIAFVVLFAYFMWMPTRSASARTVWHGLGLVALGAVVLVLAGGHRALQRHDRLAVGAIGASVLFYAVPVAMDVFRAFVRYMDPSRMTYMHVDGERVVEPFWLEFLDAFAIDAGLMFWIVPPTMAAVIARARPSSVTDLKDLYWIGVVVVSFYGVFLPAVGVFNDVIRPDTTPLGAGFTVTEMAILVVAGSVVLGVAWGLALVAYAYLPEPSGNESSAAVADGGRE